MMTVRCSGVVLGILQGHICDRRTWMLSEKPLDYIGYTLYRREGQIHQPQGGISAVRHSV